MERAGSMYYRVQLEWIECMEHANFAVLQLHSYSKILMENWRILYFDDNVKFSDLHYTLLSSFENQLKEKDCRHLRALSRCINVALRT